MSFSHLTLPIYGVQYHPESIITTCGRSIIENFLRVCG
jgi:anthranilate synthase component 2